MTLTRTITVAAGVFAPGHLGELTWQVPFELALGLFPQLGYLNVWRKLTAA